jgi:hypothetical protein
MNRIIGLSGEAALRVFVTAAKVWLSAPMEITSRSSETGLKNLWTFSISVHLRKIGFEP